MMDEPPVFVERSELVADVTIMLKPRHMARHRARIVRPRRGPSFVQIYTDPISAGSQEKLRDALRALLPAGWQRLDEPLKVVIWAMLPELASTPKRARWTALPSTKPDADNYSRLFTDSSNAILWTDDSRIVDLRVIKRYAVDSPPYWRIKVWRVSLEAVESPQKLLSLFAST